MGRLSHERPTCRRKKFAQRLAIARPAGINGVGARMQPSVCGAAVGEGVSIMFQETAQAAAGQVCTGVWCFAGDISTGDILSAGMAFLSVAAAIGVVVLQGHKSDELFKKQSLNSDELFKKQSLKSDELFRDQNAESARLQKTEIYQGLELASTRVFEFEAQNRRALEKFRDIYPLESKITPLRRRVLENYRFLEAGADANTLIPETEERPVIDADQTEKMVTFDAQATYEELEEDLRVLRKYYEITMNLFEVSARFRKENIFREDVFGSWTIWYFETCREWGFRWWWPDLRKNYVPDVRKIFDYPVEAYQFEPKPGFEERLKKMDREQTLVALEKRQRVLEKVEEDFFFHVAEIYGCGVVMGWKKGLDHDRTHIQNELKLGARHVHDEAPYEDFDMSDCRQSVRKGFAKSLIPSAFLDADQRGQRGWSDAELASLEEDE
jgi:hypothetical protein